MKIVKASRDSTVGIEKEGKTAEGGFFVEVYVRSSNKIYYKICLCSQNRFTTINEGRLEKLDHSVLSMS